jgi:transcriptional antiterminator NusG
MTENLPTQEPTPTTVDLTPPAPPPEVEPSAAEPSAETAADVPAPEGTAEPVPPEPVAAEPPAPEEPEPTLAAEPELPATAAEYKKPRERKPQPEPEAEPEPAPAAASNKHWYVVKVQSGREEKIKEAIERRVKIDGLEEYFGQIVIPVEKVTELRSGKKVTRERKLYPGYLMVECEYNDRILYLFRETSGVGDFVGGGVNRTPPPMSQREIDRMRGAPQERPGIQAGKAPFDRGDRVRIKDGTFAGMEGEVKEILEAKSLVRVELTIFGRPVPVELEYWQVEVI